MSTGLYRVYWKRITHKWIFEAAFVYKADADSWIGAELNGMQDHCDYKIMHMGKKVWSNV